MKYLDSIPIGNAHRTAVSPVIARLSRAKWFKTALALKSTGALMTTLFLFLIGLNASAQVSYTQNFNTTGLNSWTNQNGSGASTTATPCVTRSIRYNHWSVSTATWNFASPSLTGNNGGQITMTYQYKVINYSGGAGSAANWGTIKVQYASALAGPWTDAPGSEINSTNHVVSNTCATKTATFTPGIGALFVRFNSVWNSASGSDVYVYFDEVAISQGAPPSCFGPTALTTSGLSTSGATVSWTAASPVPSGGYDIEIRTSGAAGSGAAGLVASTGTTNTTYTFSSLTANTNYIVYIRSNCGGSDLSAWASTSFYTGYCVSTSTSAANGHIASFATVGEVQDITNNATGGSAGGYGNYTAQAVMAAPGDAVNFTATINSSSGFRIWVDYNNDLTFADPAERVYASGAYVTSVTNSFTIPVGTAPGSYRMRIRSDWNSTTPAVCGNISAGETEDYTLTVVGPCSAAPNAPTVAATVSTFCQGGATVLNGSAFGPYSGFTHQWKSSTTAGGPYSNVLPANPNVSYNFVQIDNIYNDGWDGSVLQLLDASNNVVATFNGPAAGAATPLTTPVSLQMGSTYTLVWSTPGLYPEEKNITINSNTGSTVFSLAAGTAAQAVTGTVLTTFTVPSTYGVSASFNPGVLAAGTYYYVLESTCPNGGGAATSSELTITVNALPNVVISGPNGGAFCGTQEMTVTGASTYTWAPANKVSALNGSSVFFIGTSNSSITVTGVDANGCTATSPAFAVTYTAPTDITLTSSVTNFCGTGGTAVITASSSAAYTYTFDVVGGDATLSNTTATTVDAAMTATSAIRVTGNEASTGCSSQAVKSVGVYPLPTATVTTTASGVCPGTAATINSGLSAGNFTVSSIPWSAATPPANASVLMNNGTAVTPLTGGNTDDGGWGGIPIGFNFNFFGTNFSSLACGTNGLVMFGTVPGYSTAAGQLGQYSFNGNASTCTPAGPATGRFFPNCNNPGNVIALMAADGHAGTSTNGSIKYWTEGYAPNRIFNLKYTNYNFYSANPQFTASLRLYETTGIVDILIDSKTYSNTAIVGLQDATKTIGAVAPNRPTSATNTVAAWTVAAGSGEAWRFSPPANYNVNWYADGVQLPAQVTSPSAGFNEFSYNVAPSVTTEYSIVYTNTLTGCSNAVGSAEVTMDVLSSTAPAGVTTIASDSTVCSNIAFDLSTSYTGNTDGQTYQWQVSTDAGNSWTDMLNDTLITNPATTQTAASQYRVGIAQCGGTVAYSSPLTVSLNPYQDCYCTPTYTFGTNDGDMISNVQIVGTTLSNNTGFAAGETPYIFYTGQPNYTAELLPSSSYTVNVSTGEWGSQGFAAWIDYNDDGIFTTSVDPLLNERIGYTNGTIGSGLTTGQINASASFTITLACTPPAGVHRMRIRDAYGTSGASIDPCINYGYGQTEDYLITIQAAPTCPNPGAMTVPSATTNANDVTLQWLTGCSTATNYDFEYGPAGFTPGAGTTVSGSVTLSVTGDTATYVLNGLNSLTDYTVYYRANCGTGDYSAWSLVPTNFTTAPSCFPPTINVYAVTTSEAYFVTTPNVANPGSAFQYYISTTNTTPANGTVAGTVDFATDSVQITGLTSMTTYYLWVRSDCGAGDRSVWTSVATIAVNPCMPSYTSGTSFGDMISFVEITGTTLSNNSGFAAGDPSYEYFAPSVATQTATMNAGGTYNVNVSTGEWGDQGFAAWIDYNDDGIFTTSVDPLLNERIGATPGTIGAGYTAGSINASASFTINLGCYPPVGQHRMRVRCAYATNGVSIDPCINYGYGQTEDYMVTISGIVPFTPSFTASSTTACTGASTAVVYTTQAGQTSYTWSYLDNANAALVDGTDYSVTYSAGNESATVTWLTAGARKVEVNYNNPAGCSSTGAANVNTTVTLQTVPGSLLFTANASNTGGIITYNAAGSVGSIAGGWQKSVDGGTTWTSISPNGPNSYTFSNLTVETKFRVLVTNGNCSTLPTNIITGYVPGAGVANAISVNTIGQFGTGVQTSYTANLANIAGNEVWFAFTATGNAARIAVTGASGVADDNEISLYDGPASTPMIPLMTENDVAIGSQGAATDAGSEILLTDQLVPGQPYLISVKNNNGTGGPVSIVISYLRSSQADIMPYTNYTGVYNTTCQNFKAQFRANAIGYTVNRWANQTEANTAVATGVGTPSWVYAIPAGTGTVATTICQLGKILPANILTGAAVNYYVTVDVAYNLADAFGNMNALTASGNVVSTVGLNAEADLNVRVSDRCPVSKSATTGTIATNRSVCGVRNYDYEFAKVLPTVDLPFNVAGPVGGSRILALSAVPGIGNGQTYDVRVRAKHTDNATYTNYGTVACVKTTGVAGMPTIEDEGVIAERSFNGVTTSIYPNPNNGSSVNLNVDGMEGELNVRITDATGRMVYSNRYIVEGAMNTTMDFGQTLAGGVYMVEMTQNGQLNTMRMVVNR